MHTYEEYNKPIQELIKIMKDDYPNGFELHINGFNAELVNNQIVLTFIDDEVMKNCCSTEHLSMEEIMKNIKDMGFNFQPLE